MNRPVRLLAVFAACIGAFLLALVPIGTPGQSQSGLVASLTGPKEAEAAISVSAISIPTLLFGLQAQNNQIRVRGEIQCTEGEHARIGVVATQESTGATAEGQTVTRCTGDVQSWQVKAPKRGPIGFEPGTADIHVQIHTFDRGELTDFVEFDQEATLVEWGPRGPSTVE
jgi:hypothetical protein